ncbi:MAG: VOC family protein, partial [Halobacteriota archaeon]
VFSAALARLVRGSWSKGISTSVIKAFKNFKEDKMSRVVHFELPADDPKRAKAFYEKVFGWTITKWEGPTDYWLVATGPDGEPGINGAILPRVMPEQVTTNTISVVSVDDFTKKIVDAGGNVMMPKLAVPGQGYLAYCTDTEGNVFGVMEMDPTAK